MKVINTTETEEEEEKEHKDVAPDVDAAEAQQGGEGEEGALDGRRRRQSRCQWRRHWGRLVVGGHFGLGLGGL